MKSIWAGLLGLAAGAAAGFLTAKKLLTDRYEQLAQEEIDSVKAAFSRQKPRTEQAERAAEERKPEPAAEARVYTETVKELGYSKEPAKTELAPRIIPPEEFGGIPGYEEISLTYYADGVLADDSEQPMDQKEIEKAIGRANLSRLGEYEEDSIFVRNDKQRTDYEVLLDPRTYSDILRDKPFLAL